jgi:allantoin racemase
MGRLLLVNPNTNAVTTAAMVAIAQQTAPPGIRIEGCTVACGPAMIVEPRALAAAAQAVLRALEEASGPLGFPCVPGGQPDGPSPGHGGTLGLPGTDACLGVLIAAFGDPGLDEARARLGIPVTGIGEAGMAEAARGGRAFAVVTTTPELVDAIQAQARARGYAGAFLGTRLTPGDPQPLMADPPRLLDALETACRLAIERDGAQAVLIGGGPLAQAARALRQRLRDAPTVDIVEPIPAAVRLALQRAGMSVADLQRSWGG